ncbi:hypothetical protein [Desulfobacula phenolica]|uniref:Uncharacterized protein n=1 Tax=Desulfobacula phenolica TaxID=90732 RepID=A0A1H2K274_9BACT|nr:hypothetical protein [Desulfobacula phenolica]SDU62652.1 hypothetical protein SAMN04487931_1197 [Desulfobacula phenolica]
MIDESNPAGRLHKILSMAKRQADGKKVREVWAEAVGLENDDMIVTKGVVALYTLSQEIQSLIKMNESLNHDLYLSSFNRIDKTFFPLILNAEWKTAKGHLTDEAMTRLQFCAEELTKFYSEESLEEEDLQDIIEITDNLFDALNQSSFSDILRLTLLEEVQKVRNAIVIYKIKGAKGLKEALQGTIGAVVVSQEDLKMESEQNKEVIQKIGQLIDKLDAFTSRALKLKRMLTKPIRFLLEKVTDSECEEEIEGA